MNVRKHFTEAVTLIVAAILCAVVANALASRDRKMALVGNYPNALKVPQSSPSSSSPVTGAATRFDTKANQVASPAATTTMRLALPNSSTAANAPSSSAPPMTASAGTAAAPTTAPTTATSARYAATPSSPATTSAAAAAATSTSSAPATRPPQPATPDNALARFAPHDKQPFIEIHGDDVAYLHSKGVLFLDARRTSVYEAGHIAGAQPYSVWEADVDDKVNKLFETRGSDPKQANEPIVVYCSGGDCEDSHMLAQKLWGFQFNNVYVYKDGFPDWEKRGGAVHRGPNP